MLIVVRQPTRAVVNEPLANVEVRLQDGAGRPLDGDVTVAIESNPCGWPLDGTTTVHTRNGAAVFGDLTLRRVRVDYRLVLRSGELQAFTAPFDVVDASRPGQLIVLENTLCMKSNPQKDAESLAFVPVDDVFWLADDDLPSIFAVERATGHYLMQMPADSFVEAFPEAGACDDGDNDPSTSCSYVDEFEQVAYDETRGRLYVMNTVNNAQATPQKDHPALFWLRRQGCLHCWEFEGWHPLPIDVQYEGLVVIEGVLHVAVGRGVYRYADDPDDPDEAPSGDADHLPPPIYTAPSAIERLHCDGRYLWVILTTNVLKQVDLATQTEVASYDLATYGIAEAKGVEVIGDRLYVLEGEPPNPIYVFRREE